MGFFPGAVKIWAKGTLKPAFFHRFVALLEQYQRPFMMNPLDIMEMELDTRSQGQ